MLRAIALLMRKNKILHKILVGDLCHFSYKWNLKISVSKHQQNGLKCFLLHLQDEN